jgi:hypothetical protein
MTAQYHARFRLSLDIPYIGPLEGSCNKDNSRRETPIDGTWRGSVKQPQS